MLITIRTLQGKTISLQVQPTDDILSVKKKIKEKEGIQTRLQRLTLGNVPLENGRTLASYNIVENTVIALIERAPQKNNIVAGGDDQGNELNQLSFPYGLTTLDDQTVVICDWSNHRIIRWRIGDMQGQVIAGGRDQGGESYQLDCPTDVLVDRVTNSIIVSDRGNKRVVRWSLADGTTEGKVLLDNIACWGLAMDDEGALYVSDVEHHRVIKYKIREKEITIVAGNNGRGGSFKQLNEPSYISVDAQQSVYVSDTKNHRIVKWNKDAKEGTVVAQGFSRGLLVDPAGTVYLADYGNHQLIRWDKEKTEGTAIPVKNNEEEARKSFQPWGLSFGPPGHLFVADHSQHCIQCIPLQAAN